MSFLHDTLPSRTKFSLDLNLNHPTLLPGAQSLTELTLYRGGKLFRPKLCFMVSEAIGVPFERVAPFARIAEMVHGATLAHDDVIDAATERRNKSTLNARTTQARAILAGDLMLSRSMVELCELGNTTLLKRMAEVLEDLVTGEWLQLENRGTLSVTPQSLDAIAGYKTASMIAWCAEIPLHLKPAPPEAIQLARRLGHSLGLAFQYIDDCIDFSATSGKAFAQDLSEGLLNQVTFILISRHPRLVHYFRSIMNHALKLDRNSFVSAVGEAHFASALTEVKEKANEQIEFARDALSKLVQILGSPERYRHLHDFLNQLANREN